MDTGFLSAVVGAVTAITIAAFGWYQTRITALSGRIEKVEQTAINRADSVRKEALDTIRALADSVQAFREEISRNMMTRTEFKEDLRDFKADLRTDLVTVIKNQVK